MTVAFGTLSFSHALLINTHLIVSYSTHAPVSIPPLNKMGSAKGSDQIVSLSLSLCILQRSKVTDFDPCLSASTIHVLGKAGVSMLYRLSFCCPLAFKYVVTGARAAQMTSTEHILQLFVCGCVGACVRVCVCVGGLAHL